MMDDNRVQGCGLNIVGRSEVLQIIFSVHFNPALHWLIFVLFLSFFRTYSSPGYNTRRVCRDRNIQIASLYIFGTKHDFLNPTLGIVAQPVK